MRILQNTILFLFILPAYLICQDKITIEETENKFQAFEYHAVIELADSLLASGDSLSADNLIKILVMKGVSNYSLGNNDQSRRCFIELLKLNRDYELDPVRISPKIVVFFESIKYEFRDLVKPPEDDAISNTINSHEPPVLRVEPSVFQNRMLRSMILPGWGHLYANQTYKGWILTSASAANLGAMIYYIINTNIKEKDYLNESNQQQIQAKYDEYNTSYKIRNTLIISYAVIWLYSQLDLLFAPEESFIEQGGVELTMPGYNALPSRLNFSIRVPF